MSVCPSFWLDSPAVLVQQATEFFPFTEHDKRCTASALNSFTRFGIYLGLLLALVRMEPLWLLVGAVFAAFSAGAWFYMNGHGAVREGFLDGADTEAPIVDPRAVQDTYVSDIIGQTQFTTPTAANPFMNVLMTEYTDNPSRAPAAAVASVRSELDAYFDTMFANDPGDTYNRSQSQRQWVTMPATTIPNDQESFQNWLYRVPGQTCKEGNVDVCNFNTGAEQLPWREMRRLT